MSFTAKAVTRAFLKQAAMAHRAEMTEEESERRIQQMNEEFARSRERARLLQDLNRFYHLRAVRERVTGDSERGWFSPFTSVQPRTPSEPLPLPIDASPVGLEKRRMAHALYMGGDERYIPFERAYGSRGVGVDDEHSRAFSHRVSDWLEPPGLRYTSPTVRSADVAARMGIPWKVGDPAIYPGPDGLVFSSPSERIPRLVAAHESGHFYDPHVQQAAKGLFVPGTNKRHFETEIPAIVAENAIAMREGWRPSRHNYMYDAMQKYGPRFTDDASGDQAAVRDFMHDLRSDTSLGRTYNAWLSAQANQLVGMTPQRRQALPRGGHARRTYSYDQRPPLRYEEWLLPGINESETRPSDERPQPLKLPDRGGHARGTRTRTYNPEAVLKGPAADFLRQARSQ